MNLKALLFFVLILSFFSASEEEAECSPAAKDILKKALEARGGEIKEIKDLKVELDFVEYKEEGDRFQGVLLQFYKEPGMSRREIRDCITNETTIEGYNGKIGWYQKGKEVVLYKGRDHYQDNKNLEKELEQFKVFLKVFFLEPFLEEGETFKVKQADTPSSKDCHHLTGEDEKGVLWEIFIGKKDYHIKRVERLPKGGKREVYEFSKEYRFKGMRLPKQIQLSVNKKLRFKAGLRKVDLNVDLEDKFFQAPKK